MSRITSGLPIYSLSRHAKTLTTMSIYRGVYPVSFEKIAENNVLLVDNILTAVASEAGLSVGDKVVITHGNLEGEIGTTDTVKVLEVKKTHLS